MTEKQSPTMMMTPDQLRGLVDEQPIGYVTANGLRMLIQDEATVMLYRHDYLIRPDHVALYTRPAPAAPHYAMLDSHRRQVEQAIQSAEHPSGMSTHDGKAHIDASILRRMLAIIDSHHHLIEQEKANGNR